MESPTKGHRRNLIDGTTWEFLKSGWWILHVIAIVGVFYLGRMLVR